MKYLCLFLITFSLISCKPKDLPTKVIMEGNRVEIYLSHQSTKDEITQIKKDLLDKYRINFNTDNTAYFEDGKLRSLSLVVNLPTGQSGVTTVDLHSLQHKYCGFKTNKSANGGVQFKIGQLE